MKRRYTMSESNVRLYNAGPELLAACKRIVGGLQSGKHVTYEAWLEQALQEACAAIAAAEGK